MARAAKTVEGTISPKLQITIPAQIRDALGIHAGDKVEFTLQKGNVLELRVKRPKPSEVIAAILEQHDFSALEAEAGDDATNTLREDRWGDG